MKKCISAALAFALLLSLSCPVFAERLLKPVEEAAPAGDTVTIPDEEVPQAALPVAPLTVAQYESAYVDAAFALGETLNGSSGQEMLGSMRDHIAELADVAAPAEYRETASLFTAAKARTNDYYNSYAAVTRTSGTTVYNRAVAAGEAARKAILDAINSFVDTYTGLHPDARFTTIPVGA